nr:unnamed protein product [Haemonchus contortus]
MMRRIVRDSRVRRIDYTNPFLSPAFWGGGLEDKVYSMKCVRFRFRRLYFVFFTSHREPKDRKNINNSLKRPVRLPLAAR